MELSTRHGTPTQKDRASITRSTGLSAVEVSPKIETEAPVMEDSLPNEQESKSLDQPHQDSMSQDEDGPRDTAWYRSAHKIRKRKDLASRILRTDPGGHSALPIHEDVGVFPFLTLPRELRDLIYEDLLTLRRRPSHTTRKKWHHGTAHTSILCTCRQIRDEASRVLYSNQLLLSFTGETLGCAVEWVKVGKHTPARALDELSENESWRAWARVPAYYYTCDSFRIHVGIDCWDMTEYDQDIIEEAALRPIMDFNSVVYTILLKHPSSRIVHFKLNTVRADLDEFVSLSDEFMQTYELSCLETLGRLQGLEKVTLEGFRFQDPAYIAGIESKMLEPRPQCWKALSADYQQALSPLPPLQAQRPLLTNQSCPSSLSPKND
ncbi:hypothetical protein BDR22DRAFT_891966 [Usnea florida]